MPRTRTITTLKITFSRTKGHAIPWWPRHKVEASRELNAVISKLLGQRVTITTWTLDDSCSG